MPYDFEEILSRVQTNDPALTQLNLSGKELTNKNIIELCSALATNTTLTSLNVIFNPIDDAIMLLLRNAIIRNKHTIMGLDVFASIANGCLSSRFLPAEIVKHIGSFLIKGPARLNDISQRALVRRTRPMLFQPAGPIDPTIEIIQAVPCNE